MNPAKLNLVVHQGARFERALKFWQDHAKTTPTNLTGRTLKAQARAEWDKQLLIELTVTVTNASQGEALLVVAASATKQKIPGKYLWDLLITPTGGEPLKYIEGEFVLKGTITKANV